MSPKTPFDVSAQDFAQGIKDEPRAQVIDVRTPAEFEQGHLANAININIHDVDFDDKLDGLEKDVPYYVYCHMGGRSAMACMKMQAAGIAKTHNLAGGIASWPGEVVV